MIKNGVILPCFHLPVPAHAQRLGGIRASWSLHRDTVGAPSSWQRVGSAGNKHVLSVGPGANDGRHGKKVLGVKPDSKFCPDP